MTTEYITNQGDRLDLIAHKAYGDPFAWQPIIAANPTMEIAGSYPAGVRILIPVQEPQPLTEVEAVPPWKKNNA